jgi:DNA-binding response OmpR family regulator
MLCEGISAAGYIAILARNSNEALEYMNTSVPDIILLDAASPLAEGFELGRRIKSMPAWAGIPILFMVDRANTNQIINSYENGGIDYLSKPLSIPEVLARLLTCVTARIHTGQSSAPV